MDFGVNDAEIEQSFHIPGAIQCLLRRILVNDGGVTGVDAILVRATARDGP